MTSDIKTGTRARMTSIASSLTSSWWLIVMLTALGLLVPAGSVNAASVTLNWTAPTTNADGTALTDLSGYRIYLATTTPTCPSASFFTVPSSTTTPGSGQSVS